MLRLESSFSSLWKFRWKIHGAAVGGGKLCKQFINILCDIQNFFIFHFISLVRKFVYLCTEKVSIGATLN